MDMLKPAIESRRRRGPTLMVSLALVTGALIGVGGSLVGLLLAPHRVVIVDGPRPAVIRTVAQSEVIPPKVVAPEVVAPEIVAWPSHRPTATLTAKTSPRTEAMDVVSRDRDVPNGTADEIIDVTLTSSLAVRYIFVNGNDGAHQWDTVIGADGIRFGALFGFGDRSGDRTYHLGVSENGQWHTNPQTGALRELSAGTHSLELIGDRIDRGTRTVTVMFVDGTTITAPVELNGNCYASKANGCGGTGTSN